MTEFWLHVRSKWTHGKLASTWEFADIWGEIGVETRGSICSGQGLVSRKAPLLIHLMPQHQLPGEKQPNTTQERPLTSHPPHITCLWRKMPVPQGYFAEGSEPWEQKKEHVVIIFSASHCPYTLYIDLFYFLRAVLRVLKLIVPGG